MDELDFLNNFLTDQNGWISNGSKIITSGPIYKKQIYNS